MVLGAGESKVLVAEDTRRGDKLSVLHQVVALSTNSFIQILFGELNWLDRATKDRESDILANKVGVRTQLNKVCMHIAITKLAHKPLLYHLLISRLVICDLQSSFLRQCSCLSRKGDLWLSSVDLVSFMCRKLLLDCYFLELLHDLDALRKSLCSL